MENERLIRLISLANLAGLPIIDVRDDIIRNFNDSETRGRILRNLEKIHKAILNIPRDLDKEKISEFEYEWPHSTI
ncbi:hypothetical protein DSCW_60290 [Desulfosarcina widdelii]|uniref:Uncharacterized protein n=1 Tax=Desulfosarcina widdelii TaxID=947919 RepID=A0A5K7Z9A9_9BACT|nr:hypothetical protein [Desulfosarcina widdelii]BBO78612.1 hypothetical protein DSCW_60290 [Desulfosarcina widdelii]